MKGKCKVAVAGGAGDWGRYYLRAYNLHPECEIIALVDTARDRRKVFAEHYGIKREYDRIDDLLKDDIPDIVTAALPVSAAYDAVIACAEAGVPVITCEKPISENLAKADKMVDVCKKRGSAFSCGTALYEVDHLKEIGKWVREGNIGTIIEAAVPSGIHQQISGLGCVLMSFLRFASGLEAQSVTGWTIPDKAAFSPEDCGAYGTITLTGGVPCTLPGPEANLHKLTFTTISGTNGHLWLNRPHATLVQGRGITASPVYPEFFTKFSKGPAKEMFLPLVNDLVECFKSGKEAPCSGHDYRQALEIAIALKLSARENHREITLPLKDRDITLNPIPYRLLGGDVTGWEAINQKTPSIVE
jgi:hypothetical protein